MISRRVKALLSTRNAPRMSAAPTSADDPMWTHHPVARSRRTQKRTILTRDNRHCGLERQLRPMNRCLSRT